MFSKIPGEFVYVILAISGGVSRYLSQYLNTGVFNWGFFIANVAISSFSGYMFAKFSTLLGIQSDASYIFAGVGGFLGTKALEFMGDQLTKKNK